MNQLADATSPYLQQHAGNPVNWHPWGDAALARARIEDKPIFLSIGYAACHWCHVMAHESFEDSETAALMNEHFVNIKVDREERPDLDGIYMQAAVAMTGSGGWPLSVFLKPDLKPFYAGTYFPPIARFNLPSFRDVLRGVAKAWSQDRETLDRTATQVVEHLRRQASPLTGKGEWTHAAVQQAADNLLESYDWDRGGWGPAPKFPPAMALDFLLAHAVTQKPARADLVRLVTHCLNAMLRGGFYDVVGGGFARYSTDADWHIPHFEKMLYDNALLGRVFLHAWQVTHEAHFREASCGVFDFLIRELRHPEGGFFSSLDADSPGGEGAYYAWTREEIRNLLAQDSAVFEAAYGVTATGNWEGKIILHRAVDDATVAAKFGVDAPAVRKILERSHASLLAARATRPPPQPDRKVLASWNGLALAALAELSRSQVGTELYNRYHETATRSAAFLLSALRPDGQLRRSWRDGRCSPDVFLEDYAALILGLLEMYQLDFRLDWFRAAVDLTDEMIARFCSPVGDFYDTPAESEPVLARPRDLQDNATPSGNALACEALLKLHALTGNAEYAEIAEQTLQAAVGIASHYPIGFGRWLAVADFALGGSKQVAVIGSPNDPGYQALLEAVRADFRPHVVVAASAYPPEPGGPGLLEARLPAGGNSTAFVCRGFVCELPTTDPRVLLGQLQS